VASQGVHFQINAPKGAHLNGSETGRRKLETTSILINCKSQISCHGPLT